MGTNRNLDSISRILKVNLVTLNCAPWALNNFRQVCAGISVPYSTCKIVLRPSGLSKMLLNPLLKSTKTHPNWRLQGSRGFTRRLHGPSFPHLTFPYFISLFVVFPCYFLYFYSPFCKYFPNFPNKNRTRREEKRVNYPCCTPVIFPSFFPISSRPYRLYGHLYKKSR